ncbi:MAG: nitrous oxide-stimulated promoter family protein [Peptococcales bacterium]
MEKKDHDIKILLDFIKVYCRENHKNKEKVFIEKFNASLCDECTELAEYGVKRRMLCPKKPKPTCKRCTTPCYAPKYKERIKKVMKFSGIYLIKRGRLDYLYHYLR